MYCTLGVCCAFIFKKTYPLTQSSHLRERDGQDFKSIQRNSDRSRDGFTPRLWERTADTERRDARRHNTEGTRTPGRQEPGTAGASQETMDRKGSVGVPSPVTEPTPLAAVRVGPPSSCRDWTVLLDFYRPLVLAFLIKLFSNLFLMDFHLWF